MGPFMGPFWAHGPPRDTGRGSIPLAHTRINDNKVYLQGAIYLGPSWAHGGAMLWISMAHDGPKLGPLMAHDRPKLGPPMARDGPKLGPPHGPMTSHSYIEWSGRIASYGLGASRVEWSGRIARISIPTTPCRMVWAHRELCYAPATFRGPHGPIWDPIMETIWGPYGIPFGAHLGSFQNRIYRCVGSCVASCNPAALQ
jgi:hypothetical protein